MPQIIEVPDIGKVEFPDGMSDEDIVAAIQANSPKQQASFGERAGAAISGFNRGAAGLLGLPVDTGEGLINLGLTGYGAIKNLATGRSDSPPVLRGSLGGSESISKGLNALGVGTANPRPDDATARILNTGGQIAGGSLFPGATVKNTLAAAAGGALAGETLGPEFTGLGVIAPGAATAAVGSAVARGRQAIASSVQPNVKTFQDAGISPSAGMVTRSSFLEGVENLVSKFPGGAGIMSRFTTNLQARLGAKTNTGVSAEDAGRAIERGVKGPGGFIDRTRETWKKLDTAVSARIPQQARVAPQNTVAALDELTRPVAGATQSTSGLANPKLVRLRDDLSADLTANNGEIPYEALRVIRTRVGSMMEDSLVSGVPGGELKRLYGALSSDLEAAARAAGAEGLFARQNQYYAARMARIENVLERVIGKGKQPEDIFKAFYPTDPNQANKVRATMRSLAPDERKIVTQAVVSRLGRASPGKQDEFGEVFSSETFLTNWNKLSNGAKAQLFPDAATRNNVNKVAAASSAIRLGSRLFANPSGTAGSFAAYSVYLSPLAAVAAGSIAPVVAAAGSSSAAFLGARMLTSPRTIAWLANAPAGKPQAVAAHLARLSVIYNSSDDEALKDELEQYIQSMNGNK